MNTFFSAVGSTVSQIIEKHKTPLFIGTCVALSLYFAGATFVNHQRVEQVKDAQTISAQYSIERIGPSELQDWKMHNQEQINKESSFNQSTLAEMRTTHQHFIKMSNLEPTMQELANLTTQRTQNATSQLNQDITIVKAAQQDLAALRDYVKANNDFIQGNGSYTAPPAALNGLFESDASHANALKNYPRYKVVAHAVQLNKNIYLDGVIKMGNDLLQKKIDLNDYQASMAKALSDFQAHPNLKQLQDTQNTLVAQYQAEEKKAVAEWVVQEKIVLDEYNKASGKDSEDKEALEAFRKEKAEALVNIHSFYTAAIQQVKEDHQSVVKTVTGQSFQKQCLDEQALCEVAPVTPIPALNQVASNTNHSSGGSGINNYLLYHWLMSGSSHSSAYSTSSTSSGSSNYFTQRQNVHTSYSTDNPKSSLMTRMNKNPVMQKFAANMMAKKSSFQGVKSFSPHNSPISKSYSSMDRSIGHSSSHFGSHGSSHSSSGG